MAIIIPSKKIYGIQNPKIIENAIKQIDVTQNDVKLIETSENKGLQDVLPSGTTSDLNTFIWGDRQEPLISDESKDYLFGAGMRVDRTICSTSITLNRFKDNYYVTQVLPKIEVDFDVTISAAIATSYLGQPSPTSNNRFEFFDKTTNFNSRSTIATNYTFETSNISYNYQDNFKLESALTISPTGIKAEYSVVDTSRSEDTSKGILFSKISNQFDISPYTISSQESNDTFDFSIEFINKLTVWIAQDYIPSSQEDAQIGRPIEAVKVEMVAKEARIVYNETIKYIETSDKSISITNTETDGDAIFSIAKNDFIRSELVYDGVSGDSSLLYRKTLDLYSNGKEIVTIRCSIGDYYDENGSLVITPTRFNRMMFRHYDKVVPMVQNYWGKDIPLSYSENNLAKVFEVVKTKIIYDGSILQELVAREIGETAYSLQLPKPIISISNNTLNIFDRSSRAQTFEVYIDGSLVQTLSGVGGSPSLNLDSLNLEVGSHQIYVISKSNLYDTSEKSESITYIVRATNYYTEENAQGGLTYIITSNNYTEYYGTYTIGEE